MCSCASSAAQKVCYFGVIHQHSVSLHKFIQATLWCAPLIEPQSALSAIQTCPIVFKIFNNFFFLLFTNYCDYFPNY